MLVSDQCRSATKSPPKGNYGGFSVSNGWRGTPQPKMRNNFRSSLNAALVVGVFPYLRGLAWPTHHLLGCRWHAVGSGAALRLHFLNELLAPCGRHMAGASALGGSSRAGTGGGSARRLCPGYAPQTGAPIVF